MSKHKVLDYLSAILSEVEDHVVDIDEELSDADDGEPTTVGEGKAEGKRIINNLISSLEKLRLDIENMSHRDFCRKHGIID